MKRRWFPAVVALFTLMLLAGCAPGANELAGSAGPGGAVAGFWLGLWHGCISLITFIVSIFNPRVSVYEVHNSGALYNLGFLLGAMAAFGGGGRGAKRRSKE